MDDLAPLASPAVDDEVTVLPVANPDAELPPRPDLGGHGLRWWQIDVSYHVIRTLALCRLAWNVKLPSRQAQAQARRT